jgi:hypothetical protein
MVMVTVISPVKPGAVAEAVPLAFPIGGAEDLPVVAQPVSTTRTKTPKIMADLHSFIIDSITVFT